MDRIVFEIACELTKNHQIGTSWIAEKYNVSIRYASGLLTRAKNDLTRFPHKYKPIDDNWEETTIVPEHHKFTPRNLYREVETETFIITKQSKINHETKSRINRQARKGRNSTTKHGNS